MSEIVEPGIGADNDTSGEVSILSASAHL